MGETEKEREREREKERPGVTSVWKSGQQHYNHTHIYTHTLIHTHTQKTNPFTHRER